MDSPPRRDYIPRMPDVTLSNDELRDAAMAGFCNVESSSFDVVQLPMTDDEKPTRYLMSGREAQDPANVVALFEMLKGRAATDEERAEIERKLPKEQ